MRPIYIWFSKLHNVIFLFIKISKLTLLTLTFHWFFIFLRNKLIITNFLLLVKLIINLYDNYWKAITKDKKWPIVKIQR